MTLITLSADNIIPMFKPIMKEDFMAVPMTNKELSIFDVKELYDNAYDQKAKGVDNETFQKLMAEALQADMAYRRQLLKSSPQRHIKKTPAREEKETSKVA